MSFTHLDKLCINTIRFLAVDAVKQARSGHPGTPMGAAPMAYVLWDRFLRHNPADPSWPDRDRFILSPGHASAMLYAVLHLTGYNLPLEELKRFRQWDSKTPGHPEYGLTPGVEMTTGPLGQGFAHGVGMALTEALVGGALQPLGPYGGGPLYLRHRVRRGPARGDGIRGGIVSGDVAAGQAHLPL